MSNKNRESPSLDSVFNRLQVTPPGERKTDNNAAPSAAVKPVAKDDDSVEQLIGRKLNAKRREKRRKCVIRKAKLILPKQFSVKKKEETVNTDDAEYDEVFLNGGDACTSETPTTCGAQYLQQGSSVQTSGGTEDSSPDELASYFEQILYIPKPMSLMAQMMYA